MGLPKLNAISKTLASKGPRLRELMKQGSSRLNNGLATKAPRIHGLVRQGSDRFSKELARRRRRYLTRQEARTLDYQLTSSEGFSVDQIIELGGLSVASACLKEYPPEKRNKVLVIAGPGNNGCYGLVAARHLKHFGYTPFLVYAERREKPFDQGLLSQCEAIGVNILSEFPNLNTVNKEYAFVLDGLFGVGFVGKLSMVDEPFQSIYVKMQQVTVKMICIDIPSGWDADKGNISGDGISPTMIISIVAPKAYLKTLSPDVIHYVGGRFVTKCIDYRALNTGDQIKL